MKFQPKTNARWKQALVATLAFKSTFTFEDLVMEVYRQWPGNWSMKAHEFPDTHKVYLAFTERNAKT